jgi:hypothetical protein
MASESDIRKMLIDALRPSLLEVIQQELTPLAEVKAGIARSEAALNRRIDELSIQLSGVIANRVEATFKDLQRHFDQELEVRLTALKSQFVLNQAAVDALGDEVKRSVAWAVERVERVDQRLSAAAAALHDVATESAGNAAGDAPEGRQRQAGE